MVRFVYCFMLFEVLTGCVASTPHNINLTVIRDANKNRQVSVNSTVLIPDEEFIIRVIDVEEIITNIECFYNENVLVTFIKTNLTKETRGRYYSKGKVIPLMKWKWKCQIYRDSNRTPIEVEFNVKLQSADKVIPDVLSVNNKMVNTIASKEGRYHARGEYWYHEGEVAKITCFRNNGIFMHLQVVFATKPAPEEIISQNQVDSEQTLYLELTSMYDESYLTCNVTKAAEFYIVHLYFYKITSSIDYPTFNINDLNLAPTIADNKSLTYSYHYDYYDGEMLSILGTMQNSHNKWKCMPTRNDAQFEPVTRQKDFLSLKVQLQHDSLHPVPPSIDCRIGQTVAKLELKPFPLTIYTTLSGLSLANTIYRYRKSKNVYKVKYRQPQYNLLNLTCFSNVSGSEWDFIDTEVEAIGNRNFTYNSSTNRYISQISFISRQNIAKTTVACKYRNINDNYTFISTAEILFGASKLEEPISKQSQNQSISKPNSGTTTIENYEGNTIGSPNAVLGENTDGQLPLYLILGCVGATIFVVGLVIWMVVSLIKRKRRLDKEQETNINYENLPDHNAGAMATPAQWDNYTRETGLEDPYSYVTPPEKVMYALPRDERPPDTLYAEVCVQSDLNYASVLPKAQRTQAEYVNNEIRRDMPEYGQIQPKSMRSNLTGPPQVLPKTNNVSYAQVLPKSARNVPDGKYTNVFDNARYANTSNATSDYAEAAYSEPNIS